MACSMTSRSVFWLVLGTMLRKAFISFLNFGGVLVFMLGEVDVVLQTILELDVVGVGTDGNLRASTLWAVSFKRWKGHVTQGKAGYWVKASVGTPRCWSGHLRSPILPGDELESLFKIGNNAIVSVTEKATYGQIIVSKSSEFTHFCGRIMDERERLWSFPTYSSFSQYYWVPYVTLF